MLFTGRSFFSQDGLKLFYRDYGPRASARLPVVCLAGLSRNSADFHDLALALATHRQRPRRVVALDSRGRGRSDYDKDWRNYDFRIELGDVQGFLTAAGIEHAIFVGTSRGGILTMLLGMVRGGAVKGAVLTISARRSRGRPCAHQGLCRQDARTPRFRRGGRDPQTRQWRAFYRH